MRLIALIPARAGSKRVPGKNTKPLYGKPLMQWTIDAAKASGVFWDIAVCSDDLSLAEMADHASVRFMARRASTDTEPDIVWVRDCLETAWEGFAILRPTSPFRTAQTIRRAYDLFTAKPCDSLRAVEPVRQHPGKMWEQRGRFIRPILDKHHYDGTPWHSSPTQTLPTFYAQNASLEMAWTRVVTEHGTISGTDIVPFFTEGYEGFDINTPEDWARAEALAPALLVGVSPVSPAV